MTSQTLIPATSRKEKIQNLIVSMNSGLLERQEQVKLLLLAALAGEHVLLLGQPGTAKSELAKRLKNAFVEANYFERLLTRFSVPEELFGPLSIKALEEDSYKRLTSGYLPDASVAFIDEIFKANSAILNSLLTVLNERQFDNGNRRYPVPLISVVAASNELPEGEELNALYDRFMLRSFVHPISDNSFEQLLELEGEMFDPNLSARLKVDELADVQQMAEKVQLSSSVVELCKEFRNHLAAEEIYVSDRRWRKIIKLMKVSAFTSGFNEVSNYDAWVLPHCLWQKPEQFDGLQEVYKKAIAIDGDFSSERVATMVAAWEGKLKQDQKSTKRKFDSKGRALYINNKGNETIEKSSKVQKTNDDGELLYIDNYHDTETTDRGYGHRQNKPCMVTQPNDFAEETMHFHGAYIEGRLKEARQLTDKIQAHIKALDTQLANVQITFEEHLWIDPNLLPEASASIEQAKAHSQILLDRANKVIEGFSNLPREEDAFIEAKTLDDADSTAIEGELCE